MAPAMPSPIDPSPMTQALVTVTILMTHSLIDGWQ
jgi:hypothetical protein